MSYLTFLANCIEFNAYKYYESQKETTEIPKEIVIHHFIVLMFVSYDI